jgi:prevent-host-death family protein
MKTVSLVRARRALGRLADGVNETGEPVVLTRRGKAVARIMPTTQSSRRRPIADGFAGLIGTVTLHCSFDELQQSIRELRSETALPRTST